MTHVASEVRPLLERYPRLRETLPWTPLADLPTPVEPIRVDGVEVWVKRDDVSAVPYAGNKVRKLEFLLGDALARGATDVVTFGAAGSNHALATAIYARKLGMSATLLLMPQPNHAYVAKNLLADVAFGATVRHCEDRECAEAAARAIVERSRREGRSEPYVIPFGGTTPLSVAGTADAGLELAAQVGARRLPAPDVVYVAAGSLGTVAAVAIGLRLAGIGAEVRAVRVTPVEIANPVLYRRLVREAVRELRDRDSSVPDVAGVASAVFVDDQFGEGYAKPTPGGLEAIALAASQGLTLEPTYTAKAFAALLADARAGALEGKTVVFWNTYNSRDLAPHIAGLGVDDVPAEFHGYFEQRLV